MLLAAAQVAELLGGGVSARAVPGIMERLKVPVIPLGPGRGLGNRWARADVLDALETIKVRPGAEKPKPVRRQPADPISGRPVKDLMAELTGQTVRH